VLSGQGGIAPGELSGTQGADPTGSDAAAGPFQAPLLQSPTARMRRVAHRLLLWLAALTAALILVFGAGLWRLMQGPINLDQLTPYLGDALSRSAGGLKIAISGVSLAVDPGTGALDLSIEGVRLSTPDGEPLASFPEVSTSITLKSLLRGSIAPTRLVVERPVLRFVRGEDGAIRFGFGDQDVDAPSLPPEMLEQLAGPPRPDERFGLMRRVAVRDATFVLDDRQTGRRWQADHVDATGERSADGFAGDLSVALAIDGRKPELHASYVYSSHTRTIDLTAQIGAIEPASLASLAPELAPLEAAKFPISGTIATRFDIAGGTTEGLRLDLHFGKGSLKSELLAEGSLMLEQGALRAVYAPESSQLRLAKLDLDLGGGAGITVKGSFDGVTPALLAGGDLPALAVPGTLEITLSGVPVVKFESLWPPAFSRGGRRWVLANIHDGVLDQAAVRLGIEVNPAARSAEVVSAHGTMRYHDATISYFHELAPARKVSGTAELDDKRLVFTPTGGVVKSVHITGGALQITDLGAPIEWLTVDLAVAGPIRDVLEVIDARPLRYAHEIGVDPARVAGRTEANFHFKLPLLRDLKIGQIQYGVKASLTGAAITDVAMDRNLTDGNFAVEITGAGAHLQGSSRFDGIPLNLDAALFFKPKDATRARYQVALALNDEQRRRLAFDFLPDRIVGPVGVELTYRVTDAERAEAEAALDLHAASLSIAEAGWKKPAGAPGIARIVADLYNEQITRIRKIEIKAAGLDGKFAVALTPGAGRLDRVDIHHLIVGGDNLTGFVTRRREGGWYADLRGPTLDLSHWIKNLDTDGSPPNSPPLQIDARLGRVILGPRREVRDFAAQLLRVGADWRSARIEARLANGHRLSLSSGNEAGKTSLSFRSDDLGSTLSLFDITNNIVGGRITITGEVAETAGKQAVTGRIEGEGYNLVRAPALAQILALPSFSGAGSMLAGAGIPFSTLRGDFAYSDNHLRVENLLAYGEAIGVTANGVVDLSRDRLDLQGTLVPAYALNSILGNIPIIGSLLLGGEGQGLFGANYQVTGSAADPQVSVNPLSALAPGFLRRLLQPNFGMPPPVQQSLGVQE
jgi:AsmA-like C-terminal region/Protein of unknown function